MRNLTEGDLKNLTCVDVTGIGKTIGSHDSLHCSSIQQGNTGQCVSGSYSITGSGCHPLINALRHHRTSGRGRWGGYSATGAGNMKSATSHDIATAQAIGRHKALDRSTVPGCDAAQSITPCDAIGAACCTGTSTNRRGGNGWLSGRSRRSRNGEALAGVYDIGVLDIIPLHDGANCRAISCSDPSQILSTLHRVVCNSTLLRRGSLNHGCPEKHDTAYQVQGEESFHQQALGLHNDTPVRPTVHRRGPMTWNQIYYTRGQRNGEVTR